MENISLVLQEVYCNLEYVYLALEQETIRGDFAAIERLIDQIRSLDAPLADALKILADNFEYDQILELATKRI